MDATRIIKFRLLTVLFIILTSFPLPSSANPYSVELKRENTLSAEAADIFRNIMSKPEIIWGTVTDINIDSLIEADPLYFLLEDNPKELFAIVSYAEVNGDDCQELNNIYVELTLIRPYGFVLTLPDGNTGYIPHIDSISITTRYGALVPRTICTTHGQWGDTISLEPLYGEMESDYLCKIWIRGCNISKAFVFHGWCDEYEGIVLSFTRINPPSLILHIEDTITGVVPRVDSMWLTSSAFRAFPEAFITGNAQSGDTIDLAPLIGMTEASYTCWLRIGDCVKSRSFLYYGEAWDYCLEYTDCSVYAEAIENVMEYGITHTESFEDFHVDSIWLTTSKERDSVVLVSYAQPGEPIDVSMLNQNDYTIYIQIGDCVKIGRFYKWGDAVEALSQPTSNTPSATKILRDGQLYIIREGRKYTVTGQIIQP